MRDDPKGSSLTPQQPVDDPAAAVRALEESESFLRTILESIQEGLIVYDRELRYVVWNRYMEQLSGFAAEDVMGRRALEMFPHLKEQGVDRLLYRAIEGERVRAGSIRYMHPRTGQVKWYVGSYAPHRSSRGEIVGVVANVHDVTERKLMEEQLEHGALHDGLTGLPNRTLFLNRLGQALERTRRNPARIFATLLLDLDRFNLVNDSLGPAAGDQLLRETARRISDCLRGSDTVARIGGDQFAILLEDVDHSDDASRAAERLLHQLGPPMDVADEEVFVSASLGVALSDQTYERPEDLLRDADVAMHRAKTLGRGRFEVFSRSLRKRTAGVLGLEAALRRSVEREELKVHYQPILRLSSGRIEGFEALARWSHPERGHVSPLEFVPLAEETGLIVPLTRWVVGEACRQVQRWSREAGPLGINVNLSARQFAHPDLVKDIESILAASGIEGTSLILEITESSIVGDPMKARDVAAELKRLGVSLVIDDFGIGYSSLSLLHHVPVDGLKIDRSFLEKVGGQEDREIVRTIVLLARNLGIPATAEGVETEAQLLHLRLLGCDYAQGHLFSTPLDAEAASRLLAEQRVW